MNRKPGPSWQAKGSRRIEEENACSPIYDYSSCRRQNVNTVEMFTRVRWDKAPPNFILFTRARIFRR